MINFKKKALSLLFIPLFLTGCGAIDNKVPPLETGLQQSDKLITHSVNRPNLDHGVNDGDVRLIKNSVASTNPEQIALPITWQNAQTDAFGKITKITHFTGNHGQKCKAFRTSLNNYQGSAFYQGETCQFGQQEWVLTWLKIVDE